MSSTIIAIWNLWTGCAWEMGFLLLLELGLGILGLPIVVTANIFPLSMLLRVRK